MSSFLTSLYTLVSSLFSTAFYAFAYIATYWFPLALCALYASLMSGKLGKEMGVPDLFREDEDHPEEGRGRFLNSPVFWSCLCMTVLVFCFWTYAAIIDEIIGKTFTFEYGPESVFKALWTIILPASALSLGAILFIAWSSLTQTARLEKASPHRPARRVWWGLGGGVALVAVYFGIAIGIDYVKFHLGGPSGVYTWLLVFTALLTGTVFVISPLTRPIPALAIGRLFLLLFVIDGWLKVLQYWSDDISTAMEFYITPFVFLVLVLGLFFGLRRFNGSQFKYEIPGLNKRYDTPLDLAKQQESGDESPTGTPAPVARPIDPGTSLNRWKERVTALPGSSDKPDLVVVTTSGGAYRAAYWTAIVLDRLCQESRPDGALPGLADKIRLITGASGGMVTAAYFAALRADQATGDSADPLPSIERRLSEDTQTARTPESQVMHANGSAPWASRYADNPIERDSLTPVVQQLLSADLRSWIGRFRIPVDRGVVLESQWLTLDRTFAQFRDAEESGQVPSIIFSPMVVETGQPLLISNLDLSQIRRWTGDAALELFDLFPEARETFHLRTAVRLNATFPYISPAVSLPTEPSRRIVDAGFYDNYGINVATAFLADPHIRDWVEENVRRIVVVQINAFRGTSVADSDARLPAPLEKEKAQEGRFKRSFQWLSSPLEGAMSARKAAMVFRNEQEFRMLQGIYGDDRVQTVAFENAAETSMSWYIPKEQLRAMHADNKTRLNAGIERLKEILS